MSKVIIIKEEISVGAAGMQRVLTFVILVWNVESSVNMTPDDAYASTNSNTWNSTTSNSEVSTNSTRSNDTDRSS